MSIESLLPGQPGKADPIAKAAPLWQGVIAETAALATDELRVLIPGADNQQHSHGPAPFMPRGELLPTEGDRCLVAFDDDGDLWILAWVPAA